MVLKTCPLPRPSGSRLRQDFGIQVDPSSFKGGSFDPSNLDDADWAELEWVLYKYSIVILRGAELSPQQQYHLTLRFDPSSESYGHGSNKTSKETRSVLHPDLKTLPKQPQVQLIGNGPINDDNIAPGLGAVQLKHPHHRTFHKTSIPEAEDLEATRFYRWHIDAALYSLDPPKVTTLQALRVPKGSPQILRYDDGTGDSLTVPLGATAFVSGAQMFRELPHALKSLAVRTSVQYAPHPYVWMAPAKAMSTGLGIESGGEEVSKEELPSWTPDEVKTYPVLWRNPVTSELHLQVHPCAAEKLHVAPVPAGKRGAPGVLYPEGATIDDLQEVRSLLYRMQRPGIDPALVYPVDWEEGMLCLFHNRGVLHSVVGSFRPDEVRAFWQCHLAGTDAPQGPTTEQFAQHA